MVHVGVDLHKRVSQVAVLTADGELTQHRLENDPPRMERFFEQIPRARVAIEASGTWWWFVDLLERLGHQPVLSNPKQTKAIAAARASRTIGWMRNDWYCSFGATCCPRCGSPQPSFGRRGSSFAIE
jgi:transposase